MRKLLLIAVGQFFLLSGILAQERTISGKITDEKGNPIPSASVLVKGTQKGAVAKEDGNFLLVVPSGATTLVFSSVGKTTKEITLGAGNIVDVQLIDAAQDLSELIVMVPYGTIKKTAFTGAEATVTSRSIEKQQVTSVTRTLEGLVPGIMTTNGGGAPGSGAAIVIRGFSSINGSSSPLYVLNGVPYDGDIESISNDDIDGRCIDKTYKEMNMVGHDNIRMDTVSL